MDLRALLRYGGDIRHVTQDGPVEEPLAAALAQQQSTTEEPDAELLWLSNRLQRLWNHRASPGIVSRILRLARQWELATRRARDVVPPTAAPGRRARLRMEREA